MSVFFVHDVNHGIVRPLDRKFRVREINPVDQVSKSQTVHPKNESNISDFQGIVEDSHRNRQQASEQKPEQKKLKAIQTYQENIPDSPKLSLGKVKDIMSDPVIKIFQDQTLDAAWNLMQKNEIHHLVILNDAFEYCGLLSEKNITPYLMKFAKSNKELKAPNELPLSYFCTKDLLSTHPETLLHDLGVAMMEYGLDAVAVSENSKIIGIVTKSDIMKVLLKHQTFEQLA